MGIRRHIGYGKYLLRHKWFVMVECFRHGMIWRGLVHDLSKFRTSEWLPYAQYFYLPNGQTRYSKSAKGYMHKIGEEARFDFAWLLHQKRNRHHWQWWVLPEDDGGTKTLDMPDKYIQEMVCDWIGASRAQGHGRDIKPWYEKNKDKMQRHPVTREYVEGLIRDWA